MNGTQFLKGLVTIVIGVLLLLNTLNILSWSIWYNVLRLWPLLLVSLGISLIFRRRMSWLAPLVILLGILVGAGAGYLGMDLEGNITTEVMTFQQEMKMVPIKEDLEQEIEGTITATEPTEEGPGQTESDEENNQDINSSEIATEATKMVPEVQKANIHLSYDVGAFQLSQSTEQVYQFTIHYRYPDFEPIKHYTVSDHEANIDIHHSPVLGSHFQNPKNKIDLKLNQDILYNIFIDTGATTVDYDLTQFKINQLSINSGASDINLIAPSYDCNINIDSGVSKIKILVPREAGVKIQLDTGISMKNIANDFQKQQDNNYISDNYQSSEFRINVDIDCGLSQIDIHYL